MKDMAHMHVLLVQGMRHGHISDQDGQGQTTVHASMIAFWELICNRIDVEQ